jgi:hypothetical protein
MGSTSSSGVGTRTRARAWLDVLQLLVATRLAIVAIASLSTLVVRKDRFWGHPRTLLDLFFRWDSKWYGSIVDNGYLFVPGEQSNVAFFPLFPLLVHALSRPFGDPRAVGFVISNVALFVACLGLHALARDTLRSEQLALRSVLHLVIWPTSFFFSIFYTEGLFLALAVWSVLSAMRGRFVLAGVLAALLGATRPVGLLVVLPILIEAFEIRERAWRPRWRAGWAGAVGLLLAPSGVAAYMLYLHFRFGRAWIFLDAAATWNRRLVSPLTSIQNTLRVEPFFQALFFGVAIWSLVIIAYMCVKKVRPSLIVFAAANLAVAMSWNYLEALPRYLSVAFPLYLGSALLAERLRLLEYLLLVGSTMLLALCTILFVNGYWMT